MMSTCAEASVTLQMFWLQVLKGVEISLQDAVAGLRFFAIGDCGAWRPIGVPLTLTLLRKSLVSKKLR